MTTSIKSRRKAALSKTRAKARLEARIDPDLDDLVTQAALKQGVSKTAFVSDAARDAALKSSPAPKPP